MTTISQETLNRIVAERYAPTIRLRRTALLRASSEQLLEFDREWQAFDRYDQNRRAASAVQR
jgi:hypothetical protein